jgi:hypothetical protein
MSDAVQTAIEHLDRLNPAEIQQRLAALADEERRLRLVLRLARQRGRRATSEGGAK